MWTARKRSPPLPDRILVASYVSAGRWSQTSVCYFHPDSFVLFLWIGVCQIDSAEQLPRRRNQKSLALRRSWQKSFIPALFLYLPNPLSKTLFDSLEEKHWTRARVLLDAEQLGLVVTLEPFNNSATPAVWNSVSMCALWEESDSRVGGSRCRSVLTAPRWTGPFTPPLVDREGCYGDCQNASMGVCLVFSWQYAPCVLTSILCQSSVTSDVLM